MKERIRSGAASRQQVYYGTVLTAKAVLTLLFCTGFIVLYSVLFAQMMAWQRDHGVMKAVWDRMDEEKKAEAIAAGKFPIGVLYENNDGNFNRGLLCCRQ